jgi:hypothetical protein
MMNLRNWIAGSVFLITLLLAAPSSPASEIEVKVERVKPEKEKLPNLRFLKDNRDFFRGRMDVIRQTTHEVDPSSVVIDERMLAYQKMLEELLASQDTLSIERATEAERAFLASVTEVGELEAHLDLLEMILGEQQARLWQLQEDFLGHQNTALVIVVRGIPGNTPETVYVTDGYGERFEVILTPEERESLRTGGILQIYHDFVEPRPQTWEISLGGGEWRENQKAFLSFEPARNQLTFLQLDLADARPDEGPASVQTTAWVHPGLR